MHMYIVHIQFAHNMSRVAQTQTNSSCNFNLNFLYISGIYPSGESQAVARGSVWANNPYVHTEMS